MYFWNRKPKAVHVGEEGVSSGEARSIIRAERKTAALGGLLDKFLDLGFKNGVVTSCTINPQVHILTSDDLGQESDMFIYYPIGGGLVRSVKFMHCLGEAKRCRNPAGFHVYTYNIMTRIVKSPRQMKTLGSVDTTQEDSFRFKPWSLSQMAANRRPRKERNIAIIDS